MDVAIITFSVMFILFILLFSLSYSAQKKSKEEHKIDKKINEELLTEEFDKIFHMFLNNSFSKLSINSIAISKNGFVYFKIPNKNWIKVHIKDILGYQVKKNGKSSGLSNAIVGGLIFGGVGAIAGAILGSKKETMKSIEIKFNINNFDNPNINIEFLGKDIEYPSDSEPVKDALDTIDEILSLLKVLEKNHKNINQINETEKNTKSP